MGQYKEFELGELLLYEQPTAYIVESTNYDDSYEIPVLTAGKTFILGYTNEVEGVFDKLPVIIFDDFTTATKYVNFRFKVKSSAMKILHINTDLVDSKYIYYRMQIIQFDHSTHKRYWIQKYSKLRILLPSLKDQRRIVEWIEKLFSDLDIIVETLNFVKQQLVVYRQSVISKAFEGLEKEIFLKEIATMIDPQPSHRTPPETIGGIPYIGVGDIDYDEKKINFKEARKVSLSVMSEQLERYTIQEGDFIMGKIGTIGKPYKMQVPQNYALSANVILIQPNKKKVDSDFLFWQFASPYITQQLLKGATATSQPAFGIKKARLLSIKICDFEQQIRIVQNIESRISICDSIKKTVDLALKQADVLRQSILKQVFEERLT